MIIPTWHYETPPPSTTPPTPPPAVDPDWDYGHGQPPTDRTTADGPWLDVDTGQLYIPQEA